MQWEARFGIPWGSLLVRGAYAHLRLCGGKHDFVPQSARPEGPEALEQTPSKIAYAEITHMKRT